MDLDFSFSTLFAGFVFGVFGVYLIKEGRRRANMPSIVIGITMLIHPYFVTNPWACWGIGLSLGFAAYKLW